jgi:hypothetical protein
MSVPKGVRVGGRQKGTPNKTSLATRERILREADPIGFLISISKGKPVKVGPASGDGAGKKEAKGYPSLDQRMQAAVTLAKKIMPDLKAVEVSGELGVKHESWLDRLK